MSKLKEITPDRVRELLLADGVKPKSVSPLLTAWTWAESGKNHFGLPDATIQTYETDARRVYLLLSRFWQ